MDINSKKKLPEPSMDDMLLAGKIFVLAMLSTNAETCTFDQKDFKGPDGTDYGSFKIVVTRTDIPKDAIIIHDERKGIAR